MEMLAGVAVGHVVFSHQALPAIDLDHHLVDDGWVVIRSRKGLSLVGSDAVCGVVAYEADEIDPATWTGWCVVATGTASLVSDPAELVRYRGLLTRWVDGGGGMDQIVCISSDIVTGYQLVRTGPAPA